MIHALCLLNLCFITVATLTSSASPVLEATVTVPVNISKTRNLVIPNSSILSSKKFKKRPITQISSETETRLPIDLIFPTKSEEQSEDTKQKFPSGLLELYKIEEVPEMEEKIEPPSSTERSYSQIILDLTKLRDDLLHLHSALKTYTCTDGIDFQRFSGDYPDLNLRFLKAGVAVSHIKDKKSSFAEKVISYYNKVSTVFHLLEVFYGVKVKEIDLSTVSNMSHVSNEVPISQTEHLKELCSNLMDIESYLSDLFEAHRKYQFHPGGIEIGVESANRAFENWKDDSQSLSTLVPLSEVKEEELVRIEETIIRLNIIETQHSSTISNDVMTSTPTKGNRKTNISDPKLSVSQNQMRQRFYVMYLTDRLHFVRDCLLEISASAPIGTDLYRSVKTRLYGICEEVKGNLENFGVSDERSRRLLSFLLRVTLSKLNQLDEVLKSNKKLLGENFISIASMQAGPSSNIQEIDRVKIELERALSFLKKIKDEDLILRQKNFEEVFLKYLKQWKENVEYLKLKNWYWEPEAIIIQVMECEISGILRTMHNFAFNKPMRKNSKPPTFSDNISVSFAITTSDDEESGAAFIEESSGNYWKKWGCCH